MSFSTASHKSSWIVGPVTDLAWIILCPLLCLFGLWAAWRFLGLADQQLYVVMFSFVVMGHHMPGWLRAFGEANVYHRYQARLWCSAIALPLMIIVPTAYGFGAIAISVAAIFDLWHVAMQQHGIGRIYGAKSGDVTPSSARLDFLCVLFWYVTIVLWSDSWLAGISMALRKAGILLFVSISSETLQTIRYAFLFVSLSLLLVYGGKAYRTWTQTGVFPWLKHLAHLVGFSVLAWTYQDSSWYRAQSTQNMFHAMQYFFLVWIYGHLSMEHSSTKHSSFYQGLFGHRRGMLRFGFLLGMYGFFFYILRHLSYGLHIGALQTSDLFFLSNHWDAKRGVEVIASVAVASLLLHFYVDAFIWKVRTRSVRNTLSISGQKTESLEEKGEPWTKGTLHALAYFGLPLLLIAWLGAGEREHSPQQELRALRHDTELFSNSAVAFYRYGKIALQQKKRKVAYKAFETATALAPSLQGPAYALFQMSRRTRHMKQAVAWGELAVRARPKHGELRHRVAVAYLRLKRYKRATEHLRVALRQRRNHPSDLLLFSVIHYQQKHDQKAKYFLKMACKRARKRKALQRESLRLLRQFQQHKRVSLFQQCSSPPKKR